MKEFGPEDLTRYSGKDGAPVYISHGGKVYDVSGSELWKTGTHMMRHNAGRALDEEIGAAPHGPEVLERVPQVGILKTAPALTEKAAPLTFLEKHPFLKRHPHPSIIHFPIALLVAALVFETIFAFSGNTYFRVSSLHCLSLGFLSLPFAIASGYLTWRINYLARPMRPVRIKITLSWILVVVALVTLWRMLAGAAKVYSGAGYLLSLLIMAVLVTVTGYYGGQLTFPIERRGENKS